MTSRDEMTNRERLRESAATLRTIGESVLHELDYGDFTENDLLWFEERVGNEHLNIEKLVCDWLGVDFPPVRD